MNSGFPEYTHMVLIWLVIQPVAVCDFILVSCWFFIRVTSRSVTLFVGQAICVLLHAPILEAGCLHDCQLSPCLHQYYTVYQLQFQN
jgi:hypothetical protein